MSPIVIIPYFLSTLEVLLPTDVYKRQCEIENGGLYKYKGGYSAFLTQKEERIRHAEKEYDCLLYTSRCV